VAPLALACLPKRIPQWIGGAYLRNSTAKNRPSRMNMTAMVGNRPAEIHGTAGAPLTTSAIACDRDRPNRNAVTRESALSTYSHVPFCGVPRPHHSLYAWQSGCCSWQRRLFPACFCKPRGKPE